MLSIQSKKVIRDLLTEKRRTLTVLLAMVIGVFAVAMMASSKNLLNRNLTENYMQTNPASFSFFVKDIDQDKLAALQNKAEIGQVTTRQSIWIRMKNADGSFLPVLLYVLDDVPNPKINTYTLDEGDFPAPKNEIIIERTGKKLEALQVGQNLELHFPGYNAATYKLSGFTHDAGIAPSWMEGFLYGYVPSSALPPGYLSNYPTELKFAVAQNPLSLESISQVAVSTKGWLEEMQIKVLHNEIHEPGVHMHQKQMNALMFLILNFGVLALVLSCFLIINMISAMMAKEIKQIAIMKATGASSVQIARIYISTILAMSSLAILIGSPLGLWAGKAFSLFNASMLNFELFDMRTSWTVLLLIVLAGLLLPVLVSLFAIIRTSRVPVQESLNEQGVDQGAPRRQWLLNWSIPLKGSFLLAMRNAFRRKARLALTVTSLSLGGAIFITSFNVRHSTNQAVDNNFDKQAQDIAYQFKEPVELAKLDSIFHKQSYHYELGFRYTGSFLHGNGLSSNSFQVTAIDASSTLASPVVTKGRWIERGKNEIVINQVLNMDHGNLSIGNKLTLAIQGNYAEYTIVGICEELFTPPGIYLGTHSLIGHMGLEKGAGNFLLMDVLGQGQAKVSKANLAIEESLQANGINVVNSITKASYKTAVIEHLLIILVMLLSMTVLVVIVGGLGMATSINMNISERKRELGILRAIGILKKDIRAMVLTESLAMGSLSWLASMLLAIPLSLFLGKEFFTIFFESSMSMSFSWLGILLWILLSVAISIISSTRPASRVIHGNIPMALSYE